MNLEITELGCVTEDGVPLERGDIISIDGDTIPARLINKCRITDSEPTKVGVINPAVEETADRDALKAEAALLGIDYARNIPTDKLADLVAAKAQG